LRRNLKIIGTVGIIEQAKIKGLLATIKPDLEKLRENGFYLSDELFEKILRKAGE
jgi:predicted nucleic acid-binding protein